MKSLRFFVSVALLTATAAPAFAAEKLDRAMVAVRSSETSVDLGWRLFESDPAGRVFNVYRSTAGGEAVKLNDAPMAAGTNFVDGHCETGPAQCVVARSGSGSGAPG
jgi:hypothetical protein